MLNGLIGVNPYYTIAFIIAYILAVLTLVGTVLGIAKNSVINNFLVKKRIKGSCDIVVGFNKSSLDYLKDANNNAIFWANTPLDVAQKEYLYEQKIPFVKGELTVKNLFKKGFKENVVYNFIAFEQEESYYQILINELVKIKGSNLIIFLFLEVKYEESIVVRNEYLKLKQEDDYNLFIRTFSRYDLVSNKFIEKETIAKMLAKDFYNENKTIKEEKEINVIFAGFGKMNSSLFSLFCQNNQLVGEDSRGLKAKLVNYYIVDKDPYALNAKRLEYIVNGKTEEKLDFPEPERLGILKTINADINSIEAINEIKSLTKNKNVFNFIIVSYGLDYENAEVAMWLSNLLDKDNLKIAARLKYSTLSDEEIIYFGNESEVLSHEYIVKEDLGQLASEISFTYKRLKGDAFLAKEKEADSKMYMSIPN